MARTYVEPQAPDPVWKLLLERYQPSATAAAYATPGMLAATLNRHTRQTPALDLVDKALVEAFNTPDSRLIISMAPQEGKSVRVAGDFPVWALLQDPERRIVTASYGADLATRNGRAIRRRITSNPQLGLAIAADNGAVGDWTIDGHQGGVFSVGIGGGVTGRPADMLIIDDPIKSRAEADSATYRERVWDWWTDEASARLAPGAPVVLIMCMTGDTPVLLPDGTEKPLRDVRPGDKVATYEHGRLTTATVKNWANQGPDNLFRVRMKSGRTVRANARHPFLTINANGEEEWLRTDQIQPGRSILTATGESGAESPAQSMGAACLHAPRVCATRTTARRDGQPGTAPLRSTLRRVAALVLSTATALLTKRWTSSSRSRVGTAPSAASPRPTRTPAPTGTGNSASTTTTRPARCAACSATTATLQSATARPRPSSGQPLHTWRLTPDEVVSVEPCGREDVYDVQIDRTENFIANGLVSHNTRWHEFDLAGRLVEDDASAGWKVLNIPAQADHDPAKGETDPLGREPGEFMVSARGRTLTQWEQRKRTAGSRTWNALYQGRPSPAEGGVFKRDWWREYTQPLWLVRDDGTCVTTNPGDQVIISADFAFKDTAASDYVAIGVWLRRGPNAYLLDQVHDRLDFLASMRARRGLVAKWPQAGLKLVEDKANGTAIINTLSRSIPGIVPEVPRGGKTERANAVVPFVEAGNVWLPAAEIAPWVGDFIEEHAAFPTGKHDDQVDATSQALNRLLLSPVLDMTDDELTPDEFTQLDELGYVYTPY